MSSFIMSKDCITIIIKGKFFPLRSSNANYEAVKKVIKTATDEELLKLLDPVKSLPKAFSGKEVVFRNGRVCVDGKPISTVLAKRYAELIKRGFPAERYEKFITRAFKNMSENAVEDLYGFMEACSLPITEDGCFLAYKRINSNWTDCHTGKIDNHIGKIVSMPREQVNPNRNETCSTGLHVCSLEYLGSFSGDRTIVVKVAPEDVVSVPVDYNNAKMRCCKYEVIEELKPNEVLPDYQADVDDPLEDDDSNDDVDTTLVDKAVPKDIQNICKGLDNGQRLKVMDSVARLDKYARERNIPEGFYEALDAVSRRGLYRCAERLIMGHDATGSLPKIREVKDTLTNLKIALAELLVAKYKK